MVDVVILLDRPTEEVLKIFSNYLTLQNVGKVAYILKEYSYNLPAFLKWFAYIKENKTKKIDIRIAIDNFDKINTLIQQKENLQKDVRLSQEERDYYLRDYGYIKNEIKKEFR